MLREELLSHLLSLSSMYRGRHIHIGIVKGTIAGSAPPLFDPPRGFCILPDSENTCRWSLLKNFSPTHLEMSAVDEEIENNKPVRPCTGLRTELLKCLKETECFNKVS